MATKKKARRVIVRTYSAGVHVGELVARKGREVILRKGRRIWRWRGANTIHEIAADGVQSAAESNYTRVSGVAPGLVELTEAIEVVDMTPAAWASVCSAGWAP